MIHQNLDTLSFAVGEPLVTASISLYINVSYWPARQARVYYCTDVGIICVVARDGLAKGVAEWMAK
jgi:hypothetical protein